MNGPCGGLWEGRVGGVATGDGARLPHAWRCAAVHCWEVGRVVGQQVWGQDVCLLHASQHTGAMLAGSVQGSQLAGVDKSRLGIGHV